MKRIKLLILLLGVLVLISACRSKIEVKTEGWENIFNDYESRIDGEIMDSFILAKENYTEMELDVIALLGEQVVAGSNYMFLAKGYNIGKEDEASYKIVIVYKDLENNATITNVSDFDYSKYVGKNIKNNQKNIVGGWNVEIPNRSITLNEDVQTVFDLAVAEIKDVTYYPIATLGKQELSGINYAVLCYGEEEDKTGIYVLTLNDNLKKSYKLVSNSYVDLADYNK